MSVTGIQLGPFVLDKPIGKGGMGVVWRGFHAASNGPVAIKVITGEAAYLGDFRRAFRNEVQAVARLNHPGVIRVLDYGEVSSAASAESGGKLSATNPYLVMELAEGGTLEQFDAPLPFEIVKLLLLAILDALAHAHARDVIHRDLKPGNVLLSSHEEGWTSIKLTDFGIAHAVDAQTRTGGTKTTQGSVEKAVGTPAYMAPEQFRGFWRDYGPWTDLYALGCMSYRLAAGEEPFDGETPLELAIAHLNDAPPPLESPHRYPPEFDLWLSRLLEKDPAKRFQRAADAAWALSRLEQQPETGERPTKEIRKTPQGAGFVAPISPAHLATLSQVTMGALDLTRHRTIGSQPKTPNRPFDAHVAPPLPTTWQGSEPERASLQLVGAGLRLYGLRPVPFVDRDTERNLIWDALVQVAEDRRVRAVFLTGDSGVGKSRLIEWMCQRAEELGAATILKATHSPITGKADGLPRMVARQFRGIGLEPKAMLKRAKCFLARYDEDDEYLCRALSSFAEAGGAKQDQARSPQFADPSMRYSLLKRLLVLMGTERPVIVWLDDVQWGGDVLNFVLHLFLADLEREQLPVLILATSDTQALNQRPLERLQINELCELDRVLARKVKPLQTHQCAELVQGWLGLEQGLADRVAKRSLGNPSYAIQLVGDWIHGNRLTTGEGGFSLKTGEKKKLPGDILEMWLTRIQQVLKGQPKEAGAALELAAALGQDVDQVEWETACRAAGIPVPPTLVDVLVSSGLVRRVLNEWYFVHAMLTTGLKHIAEKGGRWSSHHLACAEMLEQRYTVKHRGIAARLGRHYAAAGEPERAIPLLAIAVTEHKDDCDYATALSLLAERDELLDQEGIGDDSQRAEGWILRAWLDNLLQNVDSAFKWADQASVAAEKNHWAKIRADALWLKGWATRLKGDLPVALDLYQHAGRLYEHLQDQIGMARCIRAAGIVARLRGMFDLALTLYAQATELYERLNDQAGLASCLFGMGWIAQQNGETERATTLLEEALEKFRALDARRDMASCLNVLADVARFSEDLDAAEEGYREAAELHRTIGSEAGTVSQLNLGLVLLQREQFDSAAALLKEYLKTVEQKGWRTLLSYIHAALLACLAEDTQPEPFDSHLGQLSVLLRESGKVDPDLAWPLEMAGRRAANVGLNERAKAAYELAKEQWAALGNEKKVEMIEQAVGALG